MTFGRLCKGACFGAFNSYAVSPKLGEDFFRRFVIPKAGARTVVEPSWITRQPRLAEHYESSTLAGSLRRKIDSASEAGFKIHEDRCGLNDCDSGHATSVIHLLDYSSTSLAMVFPSWRACAHVIGKKWISPLCLAARK